MQGKAAKEGAKGRCGGGVGKQARLGVVPNLMQSLDAEEDAKRGGGGGGDSIVVG